VEMQYGKWAGQQSEGGSTLVCWAAGSRSARSFRFGSSSILGGSSSLGNHLCYLYLFEFCIDISRLKSNLNEERGNARAAGDEAEGVLYT